MSDPTDAASFGAAVRRLAGARVDGDDTGPWRIEGQGPAGFAVDVAVTGDAVTVRIDGWTHAEPLDDPGVWAEILDLVAAAQWGKIVVTQTRAGDRVLRGEVIFASGSVRRSLGGWGGGWGSWVWRPGTTKLVRRNDGDAPATATDGGTSPTRPWIGVRGSAAAGIDAKALALDGELDLHPFSPKEVKPLVLEYIAACRDAGILQLRIVHGKGIGHLRRTVHALLDRHDAVASYRLGGMGEGSWGATLVQLRPVDATREPSTDDPS